MLNVDRAELWLSYNECFSNACPDRQMTVDYTQQHATKWVPGGNQLITIGLWSMILYNIHKLPELHWSCALARQTTTLEEGHEQLLGSKIHVDTLRVLTCIL